MFEVFAPRRADDFSGLDALLGPLRNFNRARCTE